MTHLAENIIKQLHVKLFENSAGYRLTYPLDTVVQAGDIGIIENLSFKKTGRIGKPWEKVLKCPINQYNLSTPYTTHRRVEADNTAFLDITWQDSLGLIFEFSGGFHSILDNLPDLEKEILNRMEQGTWSKDHVIVHEVISADTTSLILCPSNKTLSFKKTNEPFAWTADGNTIDIVNAENMTLSMLKVSGLTPLYRCLRLKPFDAQFMKRDGIAESDFSPDSAWVLQIFDLVV